MQVQAIVEMELHKGFGTGCNGNEQNAQAGKKGGGEEKWGEDIAGGNYGSRSKAGLRIS